MLGAVAVLVAAAIASSAGAPAGATTVPAHAVRAPGEITDDVWRGAPVVDAFVQREPEEGGKPSQRTEFRVAYDATKLYVACTPRHRARQDRRLPHPARRRIAVRLDAGDRRFVPRPAHGVRVRRQSRRRQGGPLLVQRHRTATTAGTRCGTSRSSRDADGWRAEFRIPFSQLRFHPSADSTFGFAVVREIGRLNETDTWPLLSKSATGFVSSFGELTGLKMSAVAEAARTACPTSSRSVDTQPAEPAIRSLHRRAARRPRSGSM